MALIGRPKAKPGKKVKEALTGTEKDTVRMSFRMDRGLHTRLKLEAVRQGRSLVSVLEMYVAEHAPTA